MARSIADGTACKNRAIAVKAFGLNRSELFTQQWSAANYPTVPEDVINELVEQLGGDYAEWGGIPREDNEGDVDSYLYSAVSSNSKPHYTFMKNLNSIKLLLDSSYSLNISVEIEAEQIFFKVALCLRYHCFRDISLRHLY